MSTLDMYLCCLMCRIARDNNTPELELYLLSASAKIHTVQTMIRGGEGTYSMLIQEQIIDS